MEKSDDGKTLIGSVLQGDGEEERRQRLYFCAHTAEPRREETGKHGLFTEDRGSGDGRDAEEQQRTWLRERRQGDAAGRIEAGGSGAVSVSSDSEGNRQKQRGAECERFSGKPALIGASGPIDSEHAIKPRLEGHIGDVREWRGPGWLDPDTARSVAEAGATRGFWADCDWWYGRDGKYRPAQPRILKVVAGTNRCMGYLCSDDKAEAQEEVDATPETNSAKPMSKLRCDYDEEALRRGTRGPYSFSSEEILRSPLHGRLDGGSDQEPKSSKQPPTISEEAQTVLRTLRTHRYDAGCPPSGRKSLEQFGEEFTNFVRLLPSSLALAKLHGNACTTEALQSMLSASDAERFMRNAPISDSEAWGSLTQESKARLVMGFAEGRFLVSDEGPLVTGSTGRVGKLRGYGNSVVAPVAQAFIEAYLEATQ